MEQCFRCKMSFHSPELLKKKSGKSFCSVCILHSFYKCRHCEERFVLNDFATDYKQASSLAWKARLEHESNH